MQTLKFLICNRKTDEHGNIKVAVNNVLYSDCVCYESKLCHCISDLFCAGRVALNNNSFQALFIKNCEKRLLASPCLPVSLSVCVSVWNHSSPTGLFLMKFDIWGFFENPSWRLIFDKILSKISFTLLEDLYRVMTLPHWTIFRMRIFRTKLVEKIKTHVLCPITFSENRPLYEMI